MRGRIASKTVTVYQLPNHQPILFDRNVERGVEVLDGPRHSRRPSSISIAKKARKRNITQVAVVAWADGYDLPEDGWSDDDLLPPENCREDCFWAAGPIHRELPPFRGPTPGPTDPKLNEEDAT